MDQEMSPRGTPRSSSAGFALSRFDSNTEKDMETEDVEMEVDCKRMKTKKKILEFGEKKVKRRRSVWAETERAPKVRRVLSIRSEPEKGIRIPLLFVPMNVERSPLKTEVKLESGAKGMANREICCKLADEFCIPPNEIVLRYVDRDVFKIVSASDDALMQTNKIIAYQVPHLRSRVRKITANLKELPCSLVKNSEMLMSMIYHRPYLMLRVLEGLQDPLDTKEARKGKEWVSKALHLQDPISKIDELPHLLGMKKFITDTASMEQYALLAIAVRDFSGWRHITIPQYVPYTLGKTNFRELRFLVGKHVKRALYHARRPELYAALMSKPLKLLHTGSQCRLKDFLTAGVRPTDFPFNECTLLRERITTIICDVS